MRLMQMTEYPSYRSVMLLLNTCSAITFLAFKNKLEEALHINLFLLLFGSKRILKSARHDQLHIGAAHFCRLRDRNAGLQRDETFRWDTICLGQHLTPSILARSFRS